MQDTCKNCRRRSDLNYCERCPILYRAYRKLGLQVAYADEGRLKETLDHGEILTRRQKAIIANRNTYPFNLIKLAYERASVYPYEFFSTKERVVAEAIVRYFDEHNGRLSYNRIAKDLGLSHTTIGKTARHIAIKGRSVVGLLSMMESRPVYTRNLVGRKKRDWVTTGFIYYPKANEWLPYSKLIKRKPKGVKISDTSRLKTKRKPSARP